MPQNASKILMVPPSFFDFNIEAFETNKFQQKSSFSKADVLLKVKAEFDNSVQQIKKAKIDVQIASISTKYNSPDAVFPNNWFCTTPNKEIILFPMAVPNRRNERNPEIITHLVTSENYQLLNYANKESKNIFLEGTGSIVFDHINKIAYGAISPRTNKQLLEELANNIGYTPVIFNAFGKEKELIYHTNVMLSIGDKYALIGKDTIQESMQKQVVDSLIKSGKKVIYLTKDQVLNHFTANVLQVKNVANEKVLILSKNAFDSLTISQKEDLSSFNSQFCILDIPTIEKIGGGSARCMVAELF